uniref:Uncharacterized protein n=1 Tax=Anguilla anguilla TaxID=7936 RepID=A0A0E9TUW8_ANGAN
MGLMRLVIPHRLPICPVRKCTSRSAHTSSLPQ